ncbi:MAG: hypothetical protein AABY22_28810 [Nanoarchaeota archaeon]
MNQFTNNELKAIKKYNQDLLTNLMTWIADEKEKLNDLLPQAAEEVPDFLKTEEELKDAEAELDFDKNADLKMEEDLTDEETLEKETK